jgi:uncharacterized membrane protein YfcA
MGFSIIWGVICAGLAVVIMLTIFWGTKNKNEKAGTSKYKYGDLDKGEWIVTGVVAGLCGIGGGLALA